MQSQLSSLQRRILVELAGMGWSLTGGGALVGYHLGHRQTRDLDLFWYDRVELGRIPEEVEATLRTAAFEVNRVQSGRTFCRIRVSDGAEFLPVDLVVDTTPRVQAPVEEAPGIFVDTRHEILVKKLTALLSRWAVRDLVDVQALVAAGEDLGRALLDAPKKDAGFSPQTLAWVLDTLPKAELDEGLLQYRQELIDHLLALRS